MRRKPTMVMVVGEPIVPATADPHLDPCIRLDLARRRRALLNPSVGGNDGGMEPVIHLLTECGAESIEHPGGTLLSHLKRVSALLAEWGARPALRAAGLGHAFYGTDGFPTALLDVADRDRVRRVLGEEAEGIVYRYAACDRDFTYAGLSGGGPFRDRFTGEIAVPAPGQRRDFVELTVANELDLLMVNAELRARYGEALDRLFTRCREQMSDPAWFAVRDVMG